MFGGVGDGRLRTEDIASELMRITAGLRRLARRRLTATLPDPRLTEAQRELLLVVEGQPNIGVAAAARMLHLADNSVSTLVNTLIAAGMLRRESDPADGRAVRLALTDVARERLACWRTARATLIGRSLARAGAADRAAIEAALPALRRLLDAVRDEVEGHS